MQKIDGLITKKMEDMEISEHIFTYSEEEKQNIEINAANASLVFSPKFIPFYPSIQSKYQLTNTDTLIFGFIDFYKSSSSSRFYFTNEQISVIIGCNEDTVSRSISKLEQVGLIKTSRKPKASGGSIRYITDILPISDPTKPTFPTRQNLQPNNNNINNNTKHLISKDIKEETSLSLSLKYGNEEINRILEEFSFLTGLSKSSDSKPRQWAYLFSKNMGVDHFKPCLTFLLDLWGNKITISKIETIYRNFPLYEKSLKDKVSHNIPQKSKLEFGEDGTLVEID